MNVLYIDTSDSSHIIITLKKNEEVFIEEALRNPTQAQNTLPLIEKVIKKSKLNNQDIDKIMIKTGPGSYTGLRVGISIANALSFALGKPLNDKKISDLESPSY